MRFAAKFHFNALVGWKGVIILLFSVITNHAFPQGYSFRNFNTDQGLAQSYVYSIMQDGKGYLWVGTGEGLSRYNGFTFETFTTNDSLADNFITGGIADGETLWFGHMNGRLSFFDGKKFHAVDIPQANVSPITHLAKNPDGRIWASTYTDGLLKLGESIGEVTVNLFNAQVLVVSFEFLSASTLLVGTNTGLLYCRLRETGGIEVIRPISEIPESKVTSIRKMQNQSGFYIATENEGLFLLDYRENLIKVSRIATGSNEEFTGIQVVYEDSQSNLWLGSFGTGLIKLVLSASGKFVKADRFNSTTTFATDNVKTVYEDREGNIWSGNYGDGLTQIITKPFSVYTFEKPLYGHAIYAIYFNREYQWIGTENGLVKIDRTTGKIVEIYGKGSGLPKDRITSIYSTDGRVIWIGTENYGLFRMEAGRDKILPYPISDGALENSITIITGEVHRVWVGTKKGLCAINTDSNRISWYSINQGGLPHNFISGLHLDRTDRLWVTTRSNTLAYIKEGKVYKIPLIAGGGVFTLGPIAEDSDSRIWVGSNGNGVFMVGTDSIVNLTTKEGLFSDYCYSLFGDVHENMWVGHKGGLSKIRTADFTVKTMQHFDGILDSYQFSPNAIVKDQQGKIWFGSDKGIISYDPLMENPQILPPVLGITSLKINDKAKDFTGRIVLGSGNYKISIDFLGISLKEPDLVTYQYKLEGYDQWSEITKSTTVTYNHLAEGDYTFNLKASSGDGAVSESPLTFDIVIKKPIQKEWWFYPITLVLLIAVAYIYVKRREYLFQAEKRILEEKVQERTYEIQCQKHEIELQRDMINEKNASITSSIKYASRIQMAVLPPIDLVGKLLPESFILNKPKDIVSGDFFWLSEKDNKVIFAIADCTGHGVPGAFMSLLGITFLNEIVNIQGITASDIIVRMLRDSVLNSLHKCRKDIGSADGIDIALCVLDRSTNRMQFTGAMNDLVYIRDGKLVVVKSDHVVVDDLSDDVAPFTRQEVDCKEGDIFYLYSDGFKDQLGGLRFTRYLRQRFYESLLEIHELPMVTQRELLEGKLKAWMNGNEQTDDITVMGVRL